VRNRSPHLGQCQRRTRTRTTSPWAWENVSTSEPREMSGQPQSGHVEYFGSVRADRPFARDEDVELRVMFVQPPKNALRVYRHADEIETVDDVELFASSITPRTAAVLHADELSTQDGFDHVGSGQAVGGTPSSPHSRWAARVERAPKADFRGGEKKQGHHDQPPFGQGRDSARLEHYARKDGRFAV